MRVQVRGAQETLAGGLVLLGRLVRAGQAEGGALLERGPLHVGMQEEGDGFGAAIDVEEGEAGGQLGQAGADRAGMGGRHGLEGWKGRGRIGFDRRAKSCFEMSLRRVRGRRLQPEAARGALATRGQGEEDHRGRDSGGGRAHGERLPIADV